MGEVGDTGRDEERTVRAAWGSGCRLMASRGSEKLAAPGLKGDETSLLLRRSVLCLHAAGLRDLGQELGASP